MLSEDQWTQYSQDGFLQLGPVVDAAALEGLRRRVDDLAAGRLPNSLVEFQIDTGGEYELLPEAVRQLAPGTVHYRKVQGLEHDDLYVDPSGTRSSWRSAPGNTGPMPQSPCSGPW